MEMLLMWKWDVRVLLGQQGQLGSTPPQPPPPSLVDTDLPATCSFNPVALSHMCSLPEADASPPPQRTHLQLDIQVSSSIKLI